jgi:Cu-Zn family superoxide dismutase
VNSITESETTVIAQCELQHSDTVKGTILFMQAPGTTTLIKGTITGLAPGEHGFHIHEFGDMSKGCESMGGHYNPDGVDHGDLQKGHVGDLGNITADENGTASFSIQASRVELIGDRSVVGRGLVVHADQDDLGRGGDEESLKTGNAGDRLACGVITLRSTK